MTAVRTRVDPITAAVIARRARLDRGRDGPQAGAHGLLVDHPRVRGLRLRALRRPGPAAVRVVAVDAAPVRPDPRLHRAASTAASASSASSGSPGDVVIHNHAYYGASHQPDVGVRRAGLPSTASSSASRRRPRTTSTSARSRPGSCGIVDATDAYAEGLQFNAIKIEEEGRRNDMVWQILRDNCRAPHLVVGDMEAQVAAAKIGAGRFVELIEQYGLETVRNASEDLMDYSERMLRREIETLPDGDVRGRGAHRRLRRPPGPALPRPADQGRGHGRRAPRSPST